MPTLEIRRKQIVRVVGTTRPQMVVVHVELKQVSSSAEEARGISGTEVNCMWFADDNSPRFCSFPADILVLVKDVEAVEDEIGASVEGNKTLGRKAPIDVVDEETKP